MRTNNIVTFSKVDVLVLSLASLVSAAGFLWPFFYRGESLPKTQIYFWLAVAFSFLLVVVQVSNSRLDSKSVALLGVLAALIAALRPLGAGAVGIEPMWFILILSARVFGPSFGFLLGMISMLASALLTGGVGPWLGYQLFAAAWIGLAAGLLPGRDKLRGKAELTLLIIFGVVASELFGILMDLQFWPWSLGTATSLSYLVHGDLHENISRFFTFHFATAMAWDVPRALFTSLLLALSAQSVLAALRRTQTKAAFMQPIEFTERAKA